MISEFNNSKYEIYKPSGYPTHYRRKEKLGGDLKLGMEYREIFSKISENDRKLNDFVLRSKDYYDLVRDAYASNIHESVSLEGNPLSLTQVRRSSDDYFKGTPSVKAGPVQEIINHLYSNFEGFDIMFKLPWTIETVKNTHFFLTEKTDIGGVPGEFRKGEMAIKAKDENGEEFVAMNASHPGNIEKELNGLLEWIPNSPYDAVITSAVFFHEFESIHPFSDGNGRVGRTLFQVLLQKLGLKNCKLCKFERSILKSHDLYYQLLSYTDETLDYSPLIMYVAEALLHAYTNAAEEFEKRDALKSMDEATKTIAKRSKTASWFSVADAGSWVQSIKQQSVRNKLNFLADQDVLEERGSTASKRYRFKDPFSNVKERIIERSAGVTSESEVSDQV